MSPDDPRDDPDDGGPPKCSQEFDAFDDAEDAMEDALVEVWAAEARVVFYELNYHLVCRTQPTPECRAAIVLFYDAEQSLEQAEEALASAEAEREYRARLIADCLSDHKFRGNVWLPRRP